MLKILKKLKKRTCTNERDPYGVLNENGEREITLKKICNIMGIPVPAEFVKMENRIENNVTMKEDTCTPGCFLFRADTKELDSYSLRTWAKIAKDRKIAAIFVDRTRYEKEDMQDFPKGLFIAVDNLDEKVGAFFAYIKRLYDLKTVAVTGTCGKSTTMKLISLVIPEVYDTFINKGNLNSYKSVADHIMKHLEPTNDVYIQEIGAGALGSIRKSAAMLNTDFGVILNVFQHHLKNYGSFENLFADKTCMDDFMPENGKLIVNFDDEGLAKHQFKHQVVSVGIHTEKEVDFRAINIEQNNQHLEFDVLYNEGTTHLKISILGKHNVYNALAAFALCKQFGISGDEIAQAFKKYRSIGIRQNFKRIGDYNLLIDCYNSSEDSIKADIQTVQDFNLKAGGKKILVIAGENDLGDQAEEITFHLGKTISTEGIDKIICFGVEDESLDAINYYCHGRAMYEGVLAQGFENVVYANTPALLEKEVKETIKPGDMILFKGILYIDMAPVIDKVFGTSFACSHPYYIDRSVSIEDDRYKARKIEVLEALDLVELKVFDETNVTIPDAIDDVPVHRVAGRLYEGNEYIETLNLGHGVNNVGSRAFANCVNLKRVVIPGNVKVISNSAFEGCTKLEEVIFEEGLIHIGPKAFKDCTSLKNVSLPKSVRNVPKSAFPKE